MNEKRGMESSELEAALQSHRRAASAARVVTYGSGALVVLSLMTGAVPLMILFIVISLISGYQLSKHTNELKKALGENIVGGVLEEVFGKVEYEPFGRLSDALVSGAGMVFPFSMERIGGSDRIKAEYKGLSVEMSDIELFHVEDYYDDERGVWEERESKVFQGQWLVCDFGKELAGDVHLSENAKKLRRQHKNDSVEMENAAFNDRFLVTAESAQEAYYILTPHMMEYILSVADKSGGELYMSFQRGGKLHIAVQTGRDFFELGRSEANVEKLRGKFLDELHWFTDIIDTLRVEDTLYRKTSV